MRQPAHDMEVWEMLANSKACLYNGAQHSLCNKYLLQFQKVGVLECNQQTISLISHVMKILLRIIMQWVRKKIQPLKGDKQCEFVEGKGTRKAVHLLRTIIELY